MRTPRGRDEGGAILVLALVFMVVIALMILALVNFSGNDIGSASNLLTEQALEYGAEGGVNVAIQTVRYSDDTFASLAPCVGATNAPVQVGSNAPAIYVSCLSTPANQLPANTGVSREVSFYGCLSKGGCSSSNAVVAATVDFVDLQGCSTGTISNCGESESVKSWLVHNANS